MLHALTLLSTRVRQALSGTRARFVAVILAVLLPFAAYHAVFVTKTLDQAEAEARAEALRSAEWSTRDLASAVGDGVALLRMLRLQEAVRDGTPEACSARLHALHAVLGERYTVLSRTVDGSMAGLDCISTSALPPLAASAPGVVAAAPPSRDEPLFSAVRIGAVSRRPVVILSLPVIGTEQNRWLSIALDLSTLLKGEAGLLSPGTGLVIVNDLGTVFAAAGWSPGPMSFGQTRLEALAGATLAGSVPVEGIPGGLRVAALMDPSRFGDVLASRLAEALAAFSAILAVALAGAILLAAGFVARLERLTATARRLVAGDYGARTALHEEPGDVGQLARTLDRLAEVVGERERDLLAKDMIVSSALDALSDGFALFDPEDRLVLWNSRYEELYAASAAALHYGARFEDLIRYGVQRGQYPAAIGREEAWIAERLAAHANPGEDIEQQLVDGRWLRIREVRTADGSLVGLRTDITALKAREERMARLAEQVSQFAHLASHDLQEPLRKVTTYLGLLQQSLASGNKAEAERLIAVIARSAHTGRTLVSDLLRFTKLGDRALGRAAFDLAALVREVVEQVDDGTERRLQPVIRLDLEPVCVHGDAPLVRQVVQNLVLNALKYHRPGLAAVLDVRLIASEHGAMLSVRDEGIGFDDQLKAKIFQPFVRLVSKSAYDGSGIGLALVSAILDKHGWTIDCDSRPGEGSTFRVRIPVRDVLSQGEAPDAAERAAA